MPISDKSIMSDVLIETYIWSNRHRHAGVVTWIIDLENWRYTKQKQKALFSNTFLPTCLLHFLPSFQYISADLQVAEVSRKFSILGRPL